MRYRAIISIDWGKPHNTNGQQEVICALMQAGWLLSDTTALMIETDKVGMVWHGVEIVAKGSQGTGPIKSFNFNFVASTDFNRSRKYRANKPNALTKIDGMTYPKP
jgi:hypothetical protein